MKTCIVQARMTSTRLPGKSMLSLGGEPIIKRVLKRCQSIPGIGRVICTMPRNNSEPIEKEARDIGVEVSKGPDNDVLAQYHLAARDSEIIMRVTGDCPFIEPEICGHVLSLMEDGVDYASNVLPRGFPKGLDCECFTHETLERAHREADDPYDREHVTPWMQRNVYCVNLQGNGNPEENLCIDTLDDYLRLWNRV